MTDFARLAALARGTLDAVHGEAVQFQPMERGKGPHGAFLPSATRPAADIVIAEFRDTDFAARKRAMPTIGQTGERMANRSPEIFASTAYAGPIATGDRIIKANGERFDIVSRDPDGIGNVILGLAHISG